MYRYRLLDILIGVIWMMGCWCADAIGVDCNNWALEEQNKYFTPTGESKIFFSPPTI